MKWGDSIHNIYQFSRQPYAQSGITSNLMCRPSIFVYNIFSVPVWQQLNRKGVTRTPIFFYLYLCFYRCSIQINVTDQKNNLFSCWFESSWSSNIQYNIKLQTLYCVGFAPWAQLTTIEYFSLNDLIQLVARVYRTHEHTLKDTFIPTNVLKGVMWRIDQGTKCVKNTNWSIYWCWWLIAHFSFDRFFWLKLFYILFSFIKTTDFQSAMLINVDIH